jgi:dTDP-4-dehydrorhamnose 3,5-epimerase
MISSERFNIGKTPLAGLTIIERLPIKDDRGWLERVYCQDSLSELVNGKIIRQITKTLTAKKGTVRGLHFQKPPYAETKIISCLQGKIWDVAVDLRENSPTFLNYFAVVLSEDQHLSLLVPEGFAHGFQALTNNCQIMYFNTNNHNPDAEGSINALDPKIAIQWPLKISLRSTKDANSPFLEKISLDLNNKKAT